MNDFFENCLEEVEQVVAKAKKDQNRILYSIEKKSKILLSYNSESVFTPQFDNGLVLYLTLVSKDNRAISGTSDRLHLPDVMSRLYQSLDNLLHANHGHIIASIFRDTTTQLVPKEEIRYCELSNWDIDYLQNVLSNFHNSINEEYNNKFLFKTTFIGDYSLATRGNCDGERQLIDTLQLEFNCEVSMKSNPDNRYCVTKSVSTAELGSKSIDLQDMIDEIDLYAKLQAYPFDDSLDSSIDPEVIVLDCQLSNRFLHYCDRYLSTIDRSSGLKDGELASSLNSSNFSGLTIIDDNSILQQEDIINRIKIVKAKLGTKKVLFLVGVKNAFPTVSNYIGITTLCPSNFIYSDDDQTKVINRNFINVDLNSQVLIFNASEDQQPLALGIKPGALLSFKYDKSIVLA